MQKQIINNIRKHRLKVLIGIAIFAFFPNRGLYLTFIKDYSKEVFWFYLFFNGISALLLDIILIQNLIIFINPLLSNVFKKYGKENISKILNEIEKTKEYEDKHLLLAENYLVDKKNYEYLVAYEDILNVYLETKIRNSYVEDYNLMIVDKYGDKIFFPYFNAKKDKEKIVNLILLIKSKCPNAVLGYNKEIEKYIDKNTVELSKNKKKDSQ